MEVKIKEEEDQEMGEKKEPPKRRGRKKKAPDVPTKGNGKETDAEIKEEEPKEKEKETAKKRKSTTQGGRTGKRIKKEELDTEVAKQEEATFRRSSRLKGNFGTSIGADFLK